MFILRSSWESIGGLSPAPAALPMNLSDEVFPHSMLSNSSPCLIFSHLQALYAELVEAKKAAGTSFIRCPPLVGGIYTVSPGEHQIMIFASKGLYSLCVNCNHRRRYNFVLCTIAAAKVLKFLHLSKDFLIFVRKLVDYALSLTAPSKKNVHRF